MTEDELNKPTAGGHVSLAEWLTVEKAAYGAVGLLGLGLRLLDLAASPLTPAEAMQALPAWQAAAGRAYDLAGISPLLFNLQRFSFIPFGGADQFAAPGRRSSAGWRLCSFLPCAIAWGAAARWRRRPCGPSRRWPSSSAGWGLALASCRPWRWPCWPRSTCAWARPRGPAWPRGTASGRPAARVGWSGQPSPWE